jgi:UrcA family protein
MKLKTLILAATGAAILAAAPASAKTQQLVHYDDLDLTTPDGQAILQARLDSAAWKACLYNTQGMGRPSQVTASCYRATRQELAVRMASIVANNQRGG